MKKIIAIQNPDTLDTTAIFLGETLDTMDGILSKPEMNRDIGWINCIHDEILDQSFQVVEPIVKDISHVEMKHHNIWRKKRSDYNIDDYVFDTLVEVRDDVADQFEQSTSVEALIGDDEQSTEIVNLEKYISNGLMNPRLNEVMDTHVINELVFKFRATDYIGWESVGYCVYNIDTKAIQCYISPIEFILTLGNDKYGYAGTVHALECMTVRDVLNKNAINGIKNAVETRIHEFGDKASFDSRIDNALSL